MFMWTKNKDNNNDYDLPYTDENKNTETLWGE